MDIIQQKQELRQKMRDTLKQMSSAQKEEESAFLIKEISRIITENSSVRTIATFSNLNIEPDLSELHHTLTDQRLVYPLCLESGEMEFYIVTELTQLIKGKYGIREPDPNLCQKIDLTDIDCYLCPAFAYTTEGKRLGKGGGYYDKALSNRKETSLLLGIIFSTQLVEHIPTEPHDQAVDFVIHA